MPGSFRVLVVSLVAAATLAPFALGAPAGSHSRAVASPTLVLAGSQFGRVLFDGNGRALYAFTRDRPRKSNCSGECAVAWPPYIVSGKVAAGPGARASLIGTTRRADGRLQVVYAGRPVYYYVRDSKGTLRCGNISEFGGLWLAVAASGEPVK